jgi:ssRNA-specific RNase YbeY (16S rRNA maturation enzyme)
VAKCATIDAVPLRQEFAFVIAHGVLHLLGYDHGKDMFAIGQKVTDLIHEK